MEIDDMRRYTSFKLRKLATEIISENEDFSTVQILDRIREEKGFSKIEFDADENNNHIKGAVISNESTKSIFLKSDLANSEKLFVYAHEISHVMLHSGKDHMDFIARPRLVRPERSDEETEANTLAYELVFPFEKFIQAYKENLGDIGSLAYIFKSSVYRTKERISFLKKQIILNEIDDFITG